MPLYLVKLVISFTICDGPSMTIYYYSNTIYSNTIAINNTPPNRKSSDLSIIKEQWSLPEKKRFTWCETGYNTKLKENNTELGKSKKLKEQSTSGCKHTNRSMMARSQSAKDNPKHNKILSKTLQNFRART